MYRGYRVPYDWIPRITRPEIAPSSRHRSPISASREHVHVPIHHMLPEDILALIRRERLFAQVIYLGTSRYALSRTAKNTLV